jgi:hypothetical protein
MQNSYCDHRNFDSVKPVLFRDNSMVGFPASALSRNAKSAVLGSQGFLELASNLSGRVASTLIGWLLRQRDQNKDCNGKGWFQQAEGLVHWRTRCKPEEAIEDSGRQLWHVSRHLRCVDMEKDGKDQVD